MVISNQALGIYLGCEVAQIDAKHIPGIVAVSAKEYSSGGQTQTHVALS